MPKIISNKSSADLDYPVVRPSLDLDFTQEELDPRITFSRGSIGTRVNRNRLIETVAANQPRFDYDPVTGECKGLLIEESRQNLLTYSNTFTNSAWNNSSVTRTDNVITSPDGTTNAALISNSGTTYGGLLRQYYTFSATAHTLSCFVKKINWRYIGIRIAGSLASGTFYPVFDLDTQTFITNSVTGITLSYQAFPNGWYRIALTYTPTAGNAVADIALVPANGDHFSRQGQNVYSAYVYGAQLEAGAFPTSYIPTTASTVTRSADVANMTGSNFSSWYNSTEGTLYARWSYPFTPSGFPGITSLRDSASQNGISITTNLFNHNRFGALGSNVSIFDVQGANAVRANIPSSSVIAYNTNSLRTDISYSGDGSIARLTKNVPIVNIDRLVFGNNLSNILSGHIRRVTYYPRALKPNQLQSLTQ